VTFNVTQGHSTSYTLFPISFPFNYVGTIHVPSQHIINYLPK